MSIIVNGGILSATESRLLWIISNQPFKQHADSSLPRLAFFVMKTNEQTRSKIHVMCFLFMWLCNVGTLMTECSFWTSSQTLHWKMFTLESNSTWKPSQVSITPLTCVQIVFVPFLYFSSPDTIRWKKANKFSFGLWFKMRNFIFHRDPNKFVFKHQFKGKKSLLMQTIFFSFSKHFSSL
jgi:hypothetical protein